MKLVIIYIQDVFMSNSF